MGISKMFVAGEAGSFEAQQKGMVQIVNDRPARGEGDKMTFTDDDFLLCELCRSRQIFKHDLKQRPVVICEKCWGPKQNLIVNADTAIDLLLAATYAEGIFRRALGHWKMSNGAKQMFRRAEHELSVAQGKWRTERKAACRD